MPIGLNLTKILLVCDGLDTISSVYLNQFLVGTTDNQFVQYAFAVSHVRQVGIAEKRSDNTHCNKTNFTIKKAQSLIRFQLAFRCETSRDEKMFTCCCTLPYTMRQKLTG